METYTFLREFADSWMLLALFIFFVGVVFWVFRPGGTKHYDDPSNIPFRHEDKPAPPRGQDERPAQKRGKIAEEAQDHG